MCWPSYQVSVVFFYVRGNLSHVSLAVVFRSKIDYGLMILADSRYSRYDKRSKLPKWILQFLG